MQALDGMNAREGQLQGQVSAPENDVFLVQAIERPDQPRCAGHGPAEDRLQIVEKLGRAVRERIGTQRAQGQGVNLTKPAPDRRFDRQQEVAAGEVNGFIGRFRTGYVVRAGAPVGTVDVADRLVQHRQ